MPFSQNTFKYLSKLFILCISLHNLSSHFYEYQKIIEKRNVKFPLWKIYNVLNISSSTITFPKYPLERIFHRTNIPPIVLPVAKFRETFETSMSLLFSWIIKKKKEKRMADEKKKEIAQETSGKDNKRSLFIETSVATGWHVRFIYDAIEPLPINPSTSRVSCEDESRVGWSISSGYQDDIETIVAWKSPPWEWKKSSENVFQRKNYDRLAGIGYVCALDGDSFILSKTDVSFKERDNLIIIVLNAVDGSDS